MVSHKQDSNHTEQLSDALVACSSPVNTHPNGFLGASTDSESDAFVSPYSRSCSERGGTEPQRPLVPLLRLHQTACGCSDRKLSDAGQQVESVGSQLMSFCPSPTNAETEEEGLSSQHSTERLLNQAAASLYDTSMEMLLNTQRVEAERVNNEHGRPPTRGEEESTINGESPPLSRSFTEASSSEHLNRLESHSWFEFTNLASPSKVGENEPFLNLGLRFHQIYQKRWQENLTLANDYKLLIFAIPRRNSNGDTNKQWYSCILSLWIESEDHFRSFDSEFLFDDPINGDRVFRFLLPFNSVEPVRFFLKDKESDDEDRPGPNHPHESRLYQYVPLPESAPNVNSLRDGEISIGDRICGLGITIRYVFPGSNERGYSSDDSLPTLHYYDEIQGSWVDRTFSRCSKHGDASVTLLEVRSTVFVIYDPISRHWIRDDSGCNFQIFFPGAYVVFEDGQMHGVAVRNDTELERCTSHGDVKIPQHFDLSTPRES